LSTGSEPVEARKKFCGKSSASSNNKHGEVIAQRYRKNGPLNTLLNDGNPKDAPQDRFYRRSLVQSEFSELDERFVTDAKHTSASAEALRSDRLHCGAARIRRTHTQFHFDNISKFNRRYRNPPEPVGWSVSALRATVDEFQYRQFQLGYGASAPYRTQIRESD
jgi:hypothetical protein